MKAAICVEQAAKVREHSRYQSKLLELEPVNRLRKSLSPIEQVVARSKKLDDPSFRWHTQCRAREIDREKARSTNLHVDQQAAKPKNSTSRLRSFH